MDDNLSLRKSMILDFRKQASHESIDATLRTLEHVAWISRISEVEGSEFRYRILMQIAYEWLEKMERKEATIEDCINGVRSAAAPDQACEEDAPDEDKEERSADDAVLTCGRCKSSDVVWHELQTRSADEPSTIFCECKKCGNRWKMGG